MIRRNYTDPNGVFRTPKAARLLRVTLSNDDGIVKDASFKVHDDSGLEVQIGEILPAGGAIVVTVQTGSCADFFCPRIDLEEDDELDTVR